MVSAGTFSYIAVTSDTSGAAGVFSWTAAAGAFSACSRLASCAAVTGANWNADCCTAFHGWLLSHASLLERRGVNPGSDADEEPDAGANLDREDHLRFRRD